MPRPIFLAVGTILIGSAWAGQPAPFPGVESRWEGFVRHDFHVDGANVLVVEPRQALPGRPWAWRGEFFGAFPNADVELLKRGWHLAYIQVPDEFGSPRAMKHWEKLIVYTRYKALGGPVERIVKPGLDHHPHGLTDPRPVVEFFESVLKKG